MIIARRLLPLVLLLALAGPAAARRFPVGVTTLTMTKTSVTTGQPRELEVVMWYPAGRGGTREALGRRDAAMRRGRFPLIVYSHGSCGSTTEATYLTTAWAQQGFIVAAVPHPGNRSEDGLDCVAGFGDSLSNRVPDVEFVLDALLAEAANGPSLLRGHVRTDQIGISGISFGGFTTLLAVQNDPRFKVALPIVPGGTELVTPGAITIPTMVIGSERDTVVFFPASVTAYDRVAGPRYLVELLGGNHLSVVDDCFNEQLNVSLCVADDISQEDAHALVLRYAVAFMRHHLRGDRAPGRKLTRQVDGVALTAEPRR